MDLVTLIIILILFLLKVTGLYVPGPLKIG